MAENMAENDVRSPDPAADRPSADEGSGEAEIAELRAEIARLTDQWRRAAADLDNYRKRVARESAQQRDDERARVAAQWLPVLDNLDLALEHGAADPASIVQGVQAVRDQALGILARLGYPRRVDLGTEFDPARHEAVAGRPDANATPGTVLQVVRPGYGDDERQLRPASVVVATRAD
jgi:molecular chaperone GrpE